MVAYRFIIQGRCNHGAGGRSATSWGAAVERGSAIGVLNGCVPVHEVLNGSLQVHYLGALESRLAVGGATVQVAALWWGRCSHGSAAGALPDRGAAVGVVRGGRRDA
jgi:hypothetical protein